MARHERTRAKVDSPPAPTRTAYGIGERVTVRDAMTGAVRGWGRVRTFISDDDGYAYVVEGGGPYRWRLFFCREWDVDRD